MPAESRVTHREKTPHGDLVLQLEGGERPRAALILAGTFLMDSDMAGSERELARRGLEELGKRRGRNVRALVAGLGLGITLRALLEEPGIVAADVVEIFSPVIRWNREYLGFWNGDAMRDPRVRVFETDLRGFLGAGGVAGRPARIDPSGYDLVLVDIDNGPGWLSLPANAWLYESEGLENLRRVTAIPGVIAFWSSERSIAFEEMLARLPWGEWRREVVKCTIEKLGLTLEYSLYLLLRKS
ncbi:MAG: spermidine synthase [Candidatus Eisenbacteria bacterium]